MGSLGDSKKRILFFVEAMGYVGLSISVLLAQHNTVTAVDIVADKVEKIMNELARFRMIT